MINDQIFVNLLVGSKTYKIFSDEMGNFPEFVKIVEPLQKMTSEQLFQDSADPKQTGLKLRTYKRIKYIENGKIKIDYKE